MQKICEFCEEQYEASHTKRRFCSNSCSNMAKPRGQAIKQFAEPFYKRHAERLREEKKHKMNTDPLHRLKVKARRLAREAHPNQMPCETCGDEQADRHHDDYRDPTDIRWLCKHCHANWHILHDGVWGKGKDTIGERVKKLRLSKGHSVAWVAEQLSVEVDRWQNLEDGEMQDMQLLWKIQGFYQVPMSRLSGNV